ncbi:MAG: helix-turn-helix transcriptional regulator [Conexivisphaera sp.]
MSSKDEEEDLISRVYRLILSSGSEGLLQSELWKKLDLTSRDGSRIATKLEKRRLIVREKVLQNGRWTYKLVPLVVPIDTSSVGGLPCLTCPYEDKCEPGGQISPENCQLLEKWLLENYRRHAGGKGGS